MLFIIIFHYVSSLDNGLGLTPPMGWTSRKYCSEVPFDQSDISDDFIRKTVNSLAESGLGHAGYTFILLEDCWMAKSRTNNNLIPDPNKFPKGMNDLSDYIHNMGYSLGLSGSIGKTTSSGGPGTVEFFSEDSFQFSYWKVDYVHLDDYSSDLPNRDVGFPTMSYFLNSTERPMIFSCGWGSLNIYYMNLFCNVFRAFNFTVTKWSDIMDIVDLYERYNFTENIGPGGFTNAGPIIDGPPQQVKSQLVIWSMMPSPLFISADVTEMESTVMDIYKNENLVDLNQDKLGLPGFVYYKDKSISVWMRCLEGDKIAVLFIKKRSRSELIMYGTYLNINGGFSLYKVTELWSGDFVGYLSNGDWFEATVWDTYTVVLTPVHDYKFRLEIEID